MLKVRIPVQRQLRRLGVLTLGLATLLLLLAPILAQQNTTRSDAQPDTAPRKVQPPKDLDKAKADLARAAAELQVLQAQLEQIRAALEEKQAALSMAQSQLKEAERAVAIKAQLAEKDLALEAQQQEIRQVLKSALKNNQGKKTDEKGDKVRVRVPTVDGGPAIEKRLSDMDKKLDEVLKELRDMRKSMGGGLTQQLPRDPSIPQVTNDSFDVIGGGWADKLFARKTTQDFGKVVRGTQLKYSFPIKNIYAVPLEITDVRVSNGALTAVPTKKKLGPQEEADLDIVLNTMHLAGATDTKAYIVVDTLSQGTSTAVLHVRANIEE